MPAESVLQRQLNGNSPGYVFLADADKNIFMEIPYSNLKEVSVSEDRQDQAIYEDPLRWYAPVHRYMDWTIRFGKFLNGTDNIAYTVIDPKEADPTKLEELLNECV